jgi:hypothetical protein
MTVLQKHLGTLSLNYIPVFIQQQNMLGLNAKQHGSVDHLNHAQSVHDHDIILKGHCAHSPRTTGTAFIVHQLVKKFPRFFYCAHNSPSMVPFLSQNNPVHTFKFYFFKIQFNTRSLLLPGLPSGPFASGFSH